MRAVAEYQIKLVREALVRHRLRQHSDPHQFLTDIEDALSGATAKAIRKQLREGKHSGTDTGTD